MVHIPLFKLEHMIYNINISSFSNGSSGVHFNIINNSPSPLTITGFSQGSYSHSGPNNINVYYMPAPYNTCWMDASANEVPVTILVGHSLLQYILH